MLDAYLDQIRTTIGRYAATTFVVDCNLVVEKRPGNQGFVTGSMVFLDGSQLHFSEFLDAAQDAVEKLMYSYHYQDPNQDLIFRYDNARHKPASSARDHKHAPGGLVEAWPPDLVEVLEEIAASQGWL